MSDHAHGEPHVLPLTVYFQVYGALLVLTAATVGVSLLNLGQMAIAVAMIVAVIKAGLVVGYFMHLKYDSRFLSLIFFGSLIFLAIFFGFTFLDIGARDRLAIEQGNFVLRKHQDIQDETSGTITVGNPKRFKSGVDRVLPVAPPKPKAQKPAAAAPKAAPAAAQKPKPKAAPATKAAPAAGTGAKAPAAATGKTAEKPAAKKPAAKKPPAKKTP